MYVSMGCFHHNTKRNKCMPLLVSIIREAVPFDVMILLSRLALIRQKQTLYLDGDRS